MTSIRTRVVEGYNVYFSTFKEEFDFHPPKSYRDIVVSFLNTGGASCAIITPEASELIKASGIVMPPGPAVFVLEDFFELHAKEEALAILYHEIGHLKYDHLIKVQNEGANVVNGIFDNVEFEMEAGTYAASKTSRLAMTNGLKKTFESVGRIARQYYDVLGEDLTKAYTSTDLMLKYNTTQKRFQALQD